MQNVSEGITTETAEIYKLQKSIMNNYTLIFLKLRKSVTFLEKYKKQYWHKRHKIRINCEVFKKMDILALSL